MNNKKIIELAGEISVNLEWKKRTNGNDYVCPKEDIEWQRDIIFKIHEDKMPDDTVYRFIDMCASALADAAEDSDLSEIIYELEADIYTHDLTGWLHERADHIYYLTQAIEEFEHKDGFQALSCAQKLQIEEIGMYLLSLLEQRAEELEPA